MWITQKLKNAKSVKVFLKSLMAMMSSKSRKEVSLCYLQLELEILRIAGEDHGEEYKEIMANLRREKKKNDRFTFNNLCAYSSFYKSMLFCTRKKPKLKIGSAPTFHL